MKLLLTSAGISNESLAKALKGLVGAEVRFAFIPTAANVVEGDKSWLIAGYDSCQKLGSIDIVDISAMDKKVWLPRLKAANVIVVGGGNTAYLMRWVIKSGLKKELPKLLKTRVYVGISAGSIIASKRLFANSEFLYGDEVNRAPSGLGYVEFNVRPHLNSPFLPRARDRYLRAISKRIEGDLYALDDNSGIVYVDGRIKVVSEGKWKKY